MPAPLPVPIIAVVGSRKSGKTTTVENIVRGLSRKSYRVAVAKHIHEPNFTIDLRGKDTWRHAQAGAETIVGVAKKELASIRKINTSKLTLSDIIQDCEYNIDIIVLEGFRGLVAQDPSIPKIVIAKDKSEVIEAMQVFRPILAFAGAISKAHAQTNDKIPYIDVLKEPDKLAEIIDKRVAPIIQKRRELREIVSIRINGRMVALNPFVQKVTRNVLFSIITALKDTAIKGDENVFIKIQTTHNV